MRAALIDVTGAELLEMAANNALGYYPCTRHHPGARQTHHDAARVGCGNAAVDVAQSVLR